MDKWYTVKGTYEYLVKANSPEEAIEIAEETFLHKGLSIITADSAELY